MISLLTNIITDYRACWLSNFQCSIYIDEIAISKESILECIVLSKVLLMHHRATPRSRRHVLIDHVKIHVDASNHALFEALKFLLFDLHWCGVTCFKLLFLETQKSVASAAPNAALCALGQALVLCKSFQAPFHPSRSLFLTLIISWPVDGLELWPYCADSLILTPDSCCMLSSLSSLLLNALKPDPILAESFEAFPHSCWMLWQWISFSSISLTSLLTFDDSHHLSTHSCWGLWLITPFWQMASISHLFLFDGSNLMPDSYRQQ